MKTAHGVSASCDHLLLTATHNSLITLVRTAVFTSLRSKILPHSCLVCCWRNYPKQALERAREYEYNVCKTHVRNKSSMFLFQENLFSVCLHRTFPCSGRDRAIPSLCPRCRSPACWPMPSSAPSLTEMPPTPALSTPTTPPSTSTGQPYSLRAVYAADSLGLRCSAAAYGILQTYSLCSSNQICNVHILHKYLLIAVATYLSAL